MAQPKLIGLKPQDPCLFVSYMIFIGEFIFWQVEIREKEKKNANFAISDPCLYKFSQRDIQKLLAA